MQQHQSLYVLCIPLLIAVVFVVYQYVLHPAFLSPLSKIPTAHFTARFSSSWIRWLRWSARENRTVYEAHRRYGSIILLGPNELSVNCIENGTSTIFGKSFEKPEYWAQFAIFGHRNQLSTLDAKSHAMRRKRIAKVFSKSYLQNSEDWAAVLNEVTRVRLSEVLTKLAESEDTANAVQLLRSTGVDAVTAYVFGLPIGTDFLRNPIEALRWQKMFLDTQSETYTYNPFFYDLFGFTRWLKGFGIAFLSKSTSSQTTRYGQWGLGLCDAAENLMTSDTQDIISEPGHAPVVYGQMKSVMELEGPPSTEDVEKHIQANPHLGKLYMDSYQQLEIASELIDNINATNATLGTALSFAVWELSKNSEIQSKLQTELRGHDEYVLDPSVERNVLSTRKLKALEELPFLHAVTVETLRRHAPIPGVLTRQSPPNGAVLNCGYIPGGVRVASYAYSLHRNAEVFPDPEAWLPDRWLVKSDDDDNHRAEMDRWFWAFGSGVRACSGDVAALHVIKSVLATIYRNFTTSIVDDGGMEQIDGTIGEPKEDKLIIRLRRSSES